MFCKMHRNTMSCFPSSDCIDILSNTEVPHPWSLYRQRRGFGRCFVKYETKRHSYLPARYTGCCCCYCPRRHRCIRSEAWQTVRFYTARGHRRPAGRLDITRFDDVLGNITSHTEWCYGTTDTIDYRRQRLGVETFMYSQCVTDRQTDSETASEHQASEDEDGTGGDGHFSLRSGTLPPFDSSPSWSHLGSQCSRIRIFRVFQISKKHDFLRFFWNDVSKERKKS